MLKIHFKSTTDTLKNVSKRAIPKTAEATGDLIANRISDRITRASKTLQRIIQKLIKNK